MKEIKSAFEFQVSPWFETFFALQVLTDSSSRIHARWKERALNRLPAAFHQKFKRLGASPYIWPALADTLLDIPLTLPFEERIAKFEKLSHPHLQKTILIGLLHELEPVRQVLSGKCDLFQSITRISKTKREWLSFIGLYPPEKDSLLFKGLECLVRTPAEFQRITSDLLKLFWVNEFKQTWEGVYRKLERSKEEKERLFQSCSLEEFARLSLLRVEMDERKGQIKAIRGGYTLPFKHLLNAIILPSVFNDKRHWTTFEDNPDKVVAFFPYFDPSISLGFIFSSSEMEAGEPELDPALIFKALGDTTRYAMVSLVAKAPLTSADLAKTLGVSRPTVSHHLHLLREAVLLQETIRGNTVLLSLRREVFENLSELVTNKLFYSTEKIDVKKTRTK